ncbi:MAG TPA: hypothetical protein VE442_22120 [Jatrophihabitans sp.]|jgi:hypothetical protein|nr:hypothetical protein [Jatrophihabitans sp.]
MAETMAIQQAPAQPAQPAAPAPAAAPVSSRDQRFRNLQIALFTVGALLMPLGLFAIFLGWYGVAHTKYQYDQLPYVVSGGLLGLALVFLGGFVYFGAWLARIGNEQRESSRQLTDAVLTLVDLMGQQGGSGRTAMQDGAQLVLAGTGSTVHRRDCPLIAHRDDLHPLTGNDAALGTCRVCKPDFA